MKYFLGIKKGLAWQPLKIVDRKGERVPNEILDIIQFTLTFNDKEELEAYLIDKKIIENGDLEFGYIISKGSTKDDEFERIYNGHTLYFRDSASYFKEEKIREKVNRQKYDLQFVDTLYASYLKKYDYVGRMMSSIDYRIKYENFALFLTQLISKPFTEEMIRILKRFHNAYTKGETYTTYLEQLQDTLSNSPKDLILFVHLNHPDKFKIPSLRYLREIHTLAHQIDEEGILYLEDFAEDVEENYSRVIQRFLNTVLYQYDRKTKEFKKEQGKFKIQERNLCDLGMFLYQYDVSLYHEKVKNSIEEDDDYEFSSDDGNKQNRLRR